MILGIISGYIFRRVEFLQKVEKSISVTILVLLFMLGLSIGSNKLIIKNLGEFGSQAIILAVLSLTGSILITTLIIKMFRKGDKK